MPVSPPRKTGQRSSYLQVATAILCLSALTGCTHFQGFSGFFSESVTPASFSVQPESPQAASAPEKWWTVFGNPQLDNLVQLALERNNNLIGAEARVRASQAQLDSATAGLFPTLSANVGRAERTIKGSAISPTTASTSGYTTSASLSASYEIDLWSRVRSTRSAARFNMQADNLDLEASRLAVAGQVATAWLQWVAAAETVKLLENELADYQTNLKLVEFRFKQGSIPASDVLQQRQLVESTRGNLATAKANVKVIKNSLTTLTSQPLGSLGAPEGLLPALPELPKTGVPAQVLMRRPDVRSAYDLVKAADQNVAAAIANRFPQISFQASLSDQTRDSSTLFDNWVRNLSLNLVAPLFDGGARAAQVDIQKAVLEQRVAQYQQVSLEALQEVDNALVQEASQKQVVQSLTRQLELAEQSLQRLFAGYRNGSVSYLNILNAQQSASSLRRTLLNANQQLLVFRVSLYRAISGGLNQTENTAT